MKSEDYHSIDPGPRVSFIASPRADVKHDVVIGVKIDQDDGHARTQIYRSDDGQHEGDAERGGW